MYVGKGNRRKAIEMYKVYLKHKPDGDWADEVRKKLKELLELNKA